MVHPSTHRIDDRDSVPNFEPRYKRKEPSALIQLILKLPLEENVRRRNDLCCTVVAFEIKPSPSTSTCVVHRKQIFLTPLNLSKCLSSSLRSKKSHSHRMRYRCLCMRAYLFASWEASEEAVPKEIRHSARAGRPSHLTVTQQGTYPDRKNTGNSTL